MTADSVPLPPAFAWLEPFAATWGDLRTQDERYLMRQSLPYAALEAFHAALAPRMEEVFRHLDAFDPQALPEAEARLFRTVLGMTEAAQAVEIFQQGRVPHVPPQHSVVQQWIGYAPH